MVPLFGAAYAAPNKGTTILFYEGHPISSDNGLISQQLLLQSEFYYPLHVAVGFAYSCSKFGDFITT